MLPSSRFFCRAILAATLLGGVAHAQSAVFGQPYDAASQQQKSSSKAASSNETHGGEHYHVHGRRSLPPGYQDTPSTDFQHGPDPDHLSHVERDSVTGANLTKFGSAYGSSNPVQSGQLGDASGNGWLPARGNGW
ncbi:hypothetical protein [Swingsia samuiensis]|uniref:Uncharacterized protein n=1 Tax=Swingsia samuiensis TaxID=1293412 RepID=A0A4Y6UIU7_9PROT|nr:hypothetical protein [Swingsia samuiensis]QDH17482.1 hypothetical protein E3D00_07850 [Swingsia samuiensis]